MVHTAQVDGGRSGDEASPSLREIWVVATVWIAPTMQHMKLDRWYECTSFDDALGATIQKHKSEHFDWDLAMYCGLQEPAADGDAKQSSTTEDSGMNK